ncbi:MAG: hypothetical protein KC544_13005 [Gemmatimonadetes bacterium]|nr:hypothetical protein [Gemmatimonadota bacterium]MCA9769516.1 hypothetical protein [Gemmatimonadota bacterium]MCB9519213.1 hypothetical protein [Gemmatimonadales bacterium]HRY11773.1 hypothetical protein [Candidatus Nanopelagicales bacterium]
MMEISETLFYAVCALPVLGFALGALWMREQQRRSTRQQPREVTPVPLAPPGMETRLLDALDAVQVQLAELAERQDFTERLMTQDRRQAPRRGDTPIPTPV